MLSYAIEFLLSQKYQSARICWASPGQLIIPSIPAGARLVFVGTPVVANGISIAYEIAFSPAMVPGAIVLNVQEMGRPIYSATVTGLATSYLFGAFIPIGANTQTMSIIQNTSPVAQYYEANIAYLNFDNQTNFDIAMDLLNKKSQENLLTSMLDNLKALLNAMGRLR